MPPPLNNHGWLVVNKPLGISSALIVAKVKRLVKPLKVGHAGTLDPLASGVLVIAIGEATKAIQFAMDAPKTYEFDVTWGEERSTDDAEGEVLAKSDARLTEEQIRSLLPQFQGKIEQVPPIYSALKVGGERAYNLARQGEAVQLKARSLEIYSLELNHYAPQQATFTVHCEKGTYVRSLARDMGRALGCYGYASRIDRLAVGRFTKDMAIPQETLAKGDNFGVLKEHIRPILWALDDIPAVELCPNKVQRLRRGLEVSHEVQDSPVLICTDESQNVVAVAESQSGRIKPRRVFNYDH